MNLTRMLPLAPFLLLGGVLMAQSKPLEDRAWLYIVVPAKVEAQLADPSGHFTGIDFDTKKVVSALPDSNYDPFEAIDDDVTGAQDPNPTQQLSLPFVGVQKYTLRVHPTATGTFRGEVVIGDQMRRSTRIKLVIVAGKGLRVQQYLLFLDPMDVSKCHLEPIKR